jgi:DNA-directed RNA polymerase specialized sigma24 family protein
VKVLPVTDELLAPELGELFEEHSRLVYRTAYSVTASPQDAEDVLQKLFLHLLRRGFPPGLKENPKAYLYRAAGQHVVKRAEIPAQAKDQPRH